MPLYRLVEGDSIEPKVGRPTGLPDDHVLGIGGSGMMPLALLLAASGRSVSGSDRAFDRDASDPRARVLAEAGIAVGGQHAASPAGARVVISTAIEPGHPSLAGAASVVHRSEALVSLLESLPAARRIGVAGSSGKTTTTAMIAWILHRLGLDPMVYVGGEVPGLAPSGSRWGRGPAVVEVDESDGSIERFTVGVGVVTSVSEDHKPLPEIERLFRGFLGRASRAVVAQGARHVAAPETSPIAPLARPASPLIGGFNRLNEALAVAAAGCVGVSERDALAALGDFPGVNRRLQFLARDPVAVIDDFAHNPEKIAASLEALRTLDRPLAVVFQPHGYGPTRMHAAAFGAAFSSGLSSRDRLLLLPIHDAGGTADRSIRSEAILDHVRGIRATVCRDRDEAAGMCRAFAASAAPVAVVVMGARDPSLAVFARRLADTVAPTI